MNLEKLPRILLASRSPRRSELLARMGVEFDILVPQVDEWEEPNADPRELVLRNAAIKGDSVAKGHPSRLVLSSDTTVAIDGKLLGKPADMVEARDMIGSLAGRSHNVFTSVLLQWRKKDILLEHCEESRVVFRPLSSEDITRYFSIVNPLDKAGSYGIQEGKEIIIDHFEGSLSNIMGLPVEALEEMLRKLLTEIS